MNYELAKQVKDAGFPQRLVDKERVIYDDEAIDVMYCVPTLSELIDACGSAMQLLYQTTDTEDGSVEWRCGTVMEVNLGIGKTPEEAVANLWLKLNK